MKAKTPKRAPRPKVYHHVHNTDALSVGYTPAEERVMQERKLVLIAEHNAQLEAIKNHTDKTAQHTGAQIAQVELLRNEVRELTDAFKAFTAVIGAFIGAQKVPAKTRAPKASPSEQAAKDFTPEPPAPPAPENASPPTAGTPSRIHAVPDAPTGPGDVRHVSSNQGKAEKPAPTLDTLRSALLDFMAKNGRGAGEEKLAAFKAKKISDIPQADWPAFAASLG